MHLLFWLQGQSSSPGKAHFLDNKYIEVWDFNGEVCSASKTPGLAGVNLNIAVWNVCYFMIIFPISLFSSMVNEALGSLISYFHGSQADKLVNTIGI